MRRLVHAAVFAVAISAPVLAGALVDQSVVSVLGAPGGCSSNCLVGGAAPGSPAQGGHSSFTADLPFLGYKKSGTIGIFTSPNFAGHAVQTGSNPGTQSGNFTNPANPHGHCTGSLLSQCS